MSAHVFCGRAVARFGLAAAIAVALATVIPSTTHAAQAAPAAAAPTVHAAAPARVRATSTVSTWHMNETSGQSMLDSTGIHFGKLHNVTLGQPGAQSSDGTDYSFNGHSSYVSIPSTDDLNAGSEDVHISFHLKTSSVPVKPDYDLFRKGQAPGPEYKVELQPNGQVSCTFKGDLAKGVTVQGGPDLHDGRWHQIQCERLSSTVQLTIDGQTFSKSRSVGYISNSFDVIIGAYPGGDFYKGELDEVTFSIGSSNAKAPTKPSRTTKNPTGSSSTRSWHGGTTPPATRTALPLRSRMQARSPSR